MGIFEGHPYLVIPGMQVNFREHGGTMKFIQQFVNGGDGKTVHDGDGIETTVINTKSPGAIFFVYQED